MRWTRGFFLFNVCFSYPRFPLSPSFFIFIFPLGHWRLGDTNSVNPAIVYKNHSVIRFPTALKNRSSYTTGTSNTHIYVPLIHTSFAFLPAPTSLPWPSVRKMARFNAAKSVLIVGAGNFGAATALYLATHHKDKTVTLVDKTDLANPYAASHDISKIVRDEYDDPLYMRLMLEAMPLWRGDALYSPFFHQVGMLRADPTAYGEGSLRTYRALGAETSAVWLPVEEVRRLWNGVFADANFGDLERIMYNPGSGWAEADNALDAVLRAARDEGARFRRGFADEVEFDGEGKCTGVVLDSGDRLAADVVLLCTGARTAELLAASQPERPEFHLGDRLVATGAMSFAGTLKGAQKERFRNIPVCKNVVGKTKGGLSALSLPSVSPLYPRPDS